MSLQELEDWWNEHDQMSDVVRILKRLSANDTQANGSHQAGPYVPKAILFRVVPSLNRPNEENPDVEFNLVINNSDARIARAVWYNNKLHKKGNPRRKRNETRITRLGGNNSALLEHDSTGALTVFAFLKETSTQEFGCHVWVSQDEIEEDFIEEITGSVEPGHWVEYPDLFSTIRPPSDCTLSQEDIPVDWIINFPSGKEMVQKAVDMRRILNASDPDHRLVARRKCEMEIYASLEKAIHMDRINQGFSSVDDLLNLAQTIVQRRRSRGGQSLELHLGEIFREEGIEFSYQPVADGTHPDFIFPSINDYNDSSFPPDRLRMLAAKSTVRERWRQVLKEAPRIELKHLLTLQEGVSEGQFREMWTEGVRLVVPKRLHDRYPKSVRPHLQTLESFLGEVREQAR